MKNLIILFLFIGINSVFGQTITTYAEYSPKLVFTPISEYDIGQYINFGVTYWHNPEPDFWMIGVGGSIGYLDFYDYKFDQLIRSNTIGGHFSLSDEDVWWGSAFVEYVWAHDNIITGIEAQLSLLENFPVKNCDIIFGLEMAYMFEFKRNIFGPQLGFIYELH